MRIGYHCEGHDHLILHCLLCRLAGLSESDVSATPTEAECYNDDQVVRFLGHALIKHRRSGVAASVIAIDSDGCGGTTCRLQSGRATKTRHAHHLSRGANYVEDCRHCAMERHVRQVSGLESEAPLRSLSPPVIVCVLVECIEAWVAIAQGLAQHRDDLLLAESFSGGCTTAGRRLKRSVYGMGRASRRQVHTHALPVLRELPDVLEIATYSSSFRLFADQVAGIAPGLQTEAARER